MENMNVPYDAPQKTSITPLVVGAICLALGAVILLAGCPTKPQDHPPAHAISVPTHLATFDAHSATTLDSPPCRALSPPPPPSSATAAG